MWSKFKAEEKGFTGLEAAIVLVAFVVVAAVFSYVMLGAGFFTTQKSQEVVHTGVRQASSSVASSGDVIAYSATAAGVSAIDFYVTNTAGGTDVDMDKTVLTYTDTDDTFTREYGAAYPAAGTNGWVYTPITYEVGHDDNLLERSENYKVVLDIATFAGADPYTLPVENEIVKIQIKPPEGAVLTLSRTMPAALTATTYYVVY